MKKKLLATCLATLALVACDGRTGGPPATRAPSPRTAPTPPAAPLAAAEPPAPEPPALEVAAGAARAAPDDTLAVAHEHPGRVDHLARARELRELGDLAGALLECRRALHHHPEDEEALLAIGRLGALTREHALAAGAYARLGALRPADPLPLTRQARRLLALGDAQGARGVGEAALARDPENPEAHQVLGRVHLAMGALEPAIHHFLQVLERDPDHGHALNNLGLAYLRASEDERALEALRRAATLLPTLAYVHNNLGVALERLGHREDARQAYAVAMELSPRYVKARVNSERMARVASAGGTGTPGARPPEAQLELPGE